ncbi:hypothetical protein TNCV_1897871 [Trichonephila clavipes]|uniref:BHLH domain-containing protein n=1 Tax=Trichonephila clavipes TaxID=2585209 RepID=A0A8X6WEF7_TRICX|nr:hypothetical protein TNCV_1897871 [Trichonephila clavipes]
MEVIIHFSARLHSTFANHLIDLQSYGMVIINISSLPIFYAFAFRLGKLSRVSDACSALRKLVPGLSDKTDKATVFEQAARYLKFYRDKFGTQFDQAYCERFFQDRS